MSTQDLQIRSHLLPGITFQTISDFLQPCHPPFHCTDPILTQSTNPNFTSEDLSLVPSMVSTSLHSTDNFHDLITNFSHMHPQPCSLEQHRGQSMEPSLLSNNLFCNDSMSLTSPSHSKPIVPLQDIDVDSQLPTGIELDYSLLDSAMKCSASANPIPSSDRPSFGGRFSSSAIAVTAATDAVDTGPLLESEFYFEDILGDDGVPPDGLASMVKQDEPDDSESQILKEYSTQHGNFFSPETAITNEEMSPHSSKLDNTFSTGLFPSFNNTFGPAKSEDTKPGTSMCHMLKENTEHYSVSMSSSDNAIDASAHQDDIELKCIESSLNLPHSFSDGEKFPTCDEVDENEDMNVVTGSPRSGTSMTNEQGYGTHPDLYENLPSEVRKHVDTLREKISAMPRRKLRESLAQSITLEDVEPLMFINRDELAGMLGVGVTTWKTFMHSLGVPRWPARMLKSQKVKEEKLMEKREDAERRGDRELVERISRDLEKLRNANSRRRKQLRANAQFRVANVTIKKR